MISKAFQNIVSQMSDVFPKKFGIADSTGLVLASNGVSVMEDILESIVEANTDGDSERVFVRSGYTARMIANVKATCLMKYFKSLYIIFFDK